MSDDQELFGERGPFSHDREEIEKGDIVTVYAASGHVRYVVVCWGVASRRADDPGDSVVLNALDNGETTTARAGNLIVVERSPLHLLRKKSDKELAEKARVDIEHLLRKLEVLKERGYEARIVGDLGLYERASGNLNLKLTKTTVEHL
jgi:hypothetical protein